MINTIENILNSIKENNIKFIDIRFTDIKGLWHHITIDAATINKNIFINGITFNASSIPGWKNIDDYNMLLLPDLSANFIDPFYGQLTMVILGNVLNLKTNKNYDNDPRATAIRAEKYIKQIGIGDNVFVGAEIDFFIFNSVNFSNDIYKVYFKLEGDELSKQNNEKILNNNLGHRPHIKNGYSSINPIDNAQDIRSEIFSVMKEIGVIVEKHHHGIGASQHKFTIKPNTLTKMADYIQYFKYVVQNVCSSYGKTATFMPKPILGDNGSSMNIFQSIWKNNKSIMKGNLYKNISDTAIFYIGGIIKNIKALNAFTNPSTNSYKRLISNFKNPTLLAYSSINNFVACKIPSINSIFNKYIEICFPDSMANPYLSSAAILMAGIDGIINEIHPGNALDKKINESSIEEFKKIPTMSSSLQESLESLNNNRDFLKIGNVFTDNQINEFIKLKTKEVNNYNKSPHPIEFDMYYSL